MLGGSIIIIALFFLDVVGIIFREKKKKKKKNIYIFFLINKHETKTLVLSLCYPRVKLGSLFFFEKRPSHPTRIPLDVFSNEIDYFIEISLLNK